jgi:hypothetical protein
VLRINFDSIKGFNLVQVLNYTLMGQINFIRCLVGKNLSLGAQFGLNWED